MVVVMVMAAVMMMNWRGIAGITVMVMLENFSKVGERTWCRRNKPRKHMTADREDASSRLRRPFLLGKTLDKPRSHVRLVTHGRDLC